MASSSTSPTTHPMKTGTYAPATSSDIRSPCPLINSLANHGYIPRDGRNIRVHDLTTAMKTIGLSAPLRAVFSHPIFLEHQQPTSPPPRRPFWANLWYLLRNPWAVLFSPFGLRRPGQVDSMGNQCINLDQLALPGVVEHDISLSRRDFAQGDNHTMQPDLVVEMLSLSSDGGVTLTAEDLAEYRRRRIATQRSDNPGLTYGSMQHSFGCGEIALILEVFGDGKRVSCDHVEAFFLDERLPVNEGWKKRPWWRSLGFWGLGTATKRMNELIGVEV